MDTTKLIFNPETGTYISKEQFEADRKAKLEQRAEEWKESHKESLYQKAKKEVNDLADIAVKVSNILPK